MVAAVAIVQVVSAEAVLVDCFYFAAAAVAVAATVAFASVDVDFALGKCANNQCDRGLANIGQVVCVHNKSNSTEYSGVEP